MNIRVLVEAEQIDVGEIAFNGLREVILVDEINDKTNAVLRRGVRAFEEESEDIDGVGIDAGTFVFCGVANCVTYVTREAIGLVRGERGGRGVAQWGDRLGIEFFDVDDVLCANRGYGLGGTGAGDSSAEVIVVGSQLGATAWVNIG